VRLVLYGLFLSKDAHDWPRYLWQIYLVVGREPVPFRVRVSL